MADTLYPCRVQIAGRIRWQCPMCGIMNKTQGDGRTGAIHVHHCQGKDCGATIELMPNVYLRTVRDRGNGRSAPRDPFPIVEVYCAA